MNSKPRLAFLALFFLFTLAACGHDNLLPLPDTKDTLPRNNENANPNQAPPPSGAAATKVSFVTFGDWGSGRDEQIEVANAIGDYCTVNDCDFVVTLGDNIYSSGVDDVDDPLWQERFHDVYDFLGLVFYASLGNHDNNGSIQAQINYTNRVDNWVMLAEHYTFSKPDNVQPPLVEFFIINSDWPNFDTVAEDWLDSELAESQATWKILAMHHPIYSNGSHGDGDEDYREALVAIICDRIDLVLSGHDHNFGHLRSAEDGCPIEQLVVGTGGASVRDIDPNDPRALASASMYGFGWLEVTENRILFRMIDVTGSVFYETTF